MSTATGPGEPGEDETGRLRLPRNCAESYVKDVGIVAVEGGRWEIYIDGAAGANVRKGDLLATVDSQDEAITLTGRFMQYYRENAKWMERSHDFVPTDLADRAAGDRRGGPGRDRERARRGHAAPGGRLPRPVAGAPATGFRDALPLVELPKVPARPADVLLPAEAQ